MKYTEEEKEAIEVVSNLRCYYNDESLLNEDELKENKINNNSIDLVLKLLDKQQKEIEKCKVAFNAQVEALIKMTNVYNNLYNKIREKIKELKDNRSYLSKFDDWKEKEYTNEDINNMCVEVLEDLLGE